MSGAARDPDRRLKLLCMQGPSALFTVGEAALMLKMRERDAREWLNRNGLIVEVDGRRRVYWRSVEEAIKTSGEPTPPPPNQRPKRLPRKAFGRAAK